MDKIHAAIAEVYDAWSADIYADLYEMVSKVLGYRPEDDDYEEALETFHQGMLDGGLADL